MTGLIATLALMAVPVAAQTTLSGNAWVEQVKDRPGAYVPLFEWNIYLSANNNAEPGQSHRVDAPPLLSSYQFNPVPGGTYSIFLDQPLFWGRPKVVDVVSLPGSGSVNLDVELAADYLCAFGHNSGIWGSDPWDWDAAWYQTFEATGTSITGINFKLAGATATDVQISIHEDNGGHITTWPQVGPTRGRGVIVNSDLWVRFLSDEIPTTPGVTYALKLVGVGGQGGLGIYRRIEDGQGYAKGQAHSSSGEPRNYDLYAMVFSDSDGTVIPYGARVHDLGSLMHWEWSWQQAIRAKGTGLAGAVIYFAAGTWDVPLNFQVRSGSPTGPQVGPTKTGRGAFQASSSGFAAASWNPGEVPLTPGEIYYLEVSGVPGTGGGGLTPYRFTNAENAYADGHAYANGNPQTGVDLLMQVVEYDESEEPQIPTIARSPSSLNPVTDEGHDAASQNFTVQNTGDGTLDYSISVNQSWLSVTPSSGMSTGGVNSHTVNYATSGLSPGSYSATITISDPEASNNPQTIAVNLTVHEPSFCTNETEANGSFEDGLSPWVTFGTTDGVVDSGTDQVNARTGNKMFGARANYSTKNGGAYQQISVCDGATVEATTWIYTRQIGGQNWDVNCRIGIDPTGGTNPSSSNIVWTSWTNSADQWSQIGLTGSNAVISDGETVTVFIEHEQKWNLQFNFTMFDDVEVTATGGSGGTPPTIDLNPTVLNPETNEGGSPASDGFTVQNIGGGTLDYTISASETWLWVTPDSGSNTGAQDSITVNYDTASLSQGQYQATITVSSGNATNSPQTIDVNLTVNEPSACTNEDLVNGGFENGLSPWVTFGTTDGVVDSPTDGVHAFSGSKMFGARANHMSKNGGAYQQIDVCNGASVQATTWIHTRQGGGQNWDVNCRIGIDPTGGTNPSSGNIVWTSWTNSNNQWSQIGLTGGNAVTAQGETVTIFLEHEHKWNLQFNFTMFDEVEVMITGGQ